MRDLIAWFIAAFLLVTAASLASTLRYYRLKRQRAADFQRVRGRHIIAEIPITDDLVYFTEDKTHFYYGERSINKNQIQVARVLINGSPIAEISAPRQTSRIAKPMVFIDQPEGILRDRWDVMIEAESSDILIECGAVRERVSQELARKIFDAIKAAIES